MDSQITIQLTEIVGSTYCVASEDGMLVFQQIAKALTDGYQVEISFLNVESLTSAFLNAAIGQLYGSFPEDLLSKSLSVSNIQADDLNLLKRVIDTAKLYFSRPEILNNAWEHVIGEDGDEEYNA